jgi:methylglyoxal reductase
MIMEHRKLGGMQLPAVTFGAWAIGGLFWGGSDDTEAIRAIHAALDQGIDAIDTAPAYGCGHSERLIARAIGGRRDRVRILTKCGLRWDDDSGEFYFKLEATPDGKPVTIYKNVRAKSIMHECEQSLLRLNTDYIDLYQVHWPSSTATSEETMGALLRLKEHGKIGDFGVSNYSREQMASALSHGALASNQVRYNLLDRSIEAEVLPFCRENNLGVLCYSPMALGLLTGKVTPDRGFPTSDIRSSNPLFSADSRRKVLEAIEKVRPIASAHNATPAQLAVAWVLGQPGITTALVGARNERQVAENAAAAAIKLSTEELARIGDVFAAISG